MKRSSVDRSPRTFVVAASLGATLIVLPLVGLLTKVSWSDLGSLLATARVRDAIWLSIVTSLVASALACVLGVPLGWVLARRRTRGVGLLRSIVIVPLVVPPVVGGVALLAAFGRTYGLVGGVLYDWFSLQLTFSALGVIFAQTFVALPFFALTLEGAFAAMKMSSNDFAATCGAGPWRRFRLVTFVHVRPAFFAGLALAWARALGEFGATVTFAGNIEGRTQTVPLAVYSLLESDPPAAYALSAVLLVVCVAVLVALRGRWVGGFRP